MLVVKKPLDYESVRNFTVRLRAQDQGAPPRYNDTELHVQVGHTRDTPTAILL